MPPLASLVLEPLVEPLLEPLAGAAGEFGSLVAELCAQSIAAHMRP